MPATPWLRDVSLGIDLIVFVAASVPLILPSSMV
jgi:hypothetical protein